MGDSLSYLDNLLDVINQGMSRDTINHSHVVKQVKFLLIPNK